MRTRSLAKAEALASRKMSETPRFPHRVSKKHLKNNDVLGFILRQLPVVDKIKAELVSKEWQAAAKRSWSTTYELKQDDFVDAGGKRIRVTRAKLRDLFERCGLYVKKLDLNGVVDSLDAADLRVISKFMTSLTQLSLANVGLRKSLGFLKPLGPKLKILDLSGTFVAPCVEKGVAEFVGKCSALEKLCIGYNRGLHGDHLFRHLPGTLKTLHLTESIRLEIRNLEQLGEACPQLVEFKFTNAGKIDAESQFDFLSKLARTLQVLVLRHNKDAPPLFQIADLKNLKRLDMRGSDGITTELLVKIGERCKKLEDLRLEKGVRDEIIDGEGFDVLGSLPDLRVLHVNNLVNFQDGALEAIALHGKLENVVISGCKLISNSAIQATIANCQKLKLIETTKCGTNRNLMRRWCDNFVKKNLLADSEMPIIRFDGHPLL